jgi:ribose transport system substrate-binding protein
MNSRNLRAAAATAAAVVLLGGVAAGCNRGSTTSAVGKPIGIDLPRSDSDFWNAYAQYIRRDIASGKLSTLPISNSQNDITTLAANAQVFANTGAKTIIMAPQDTGAISSTLDQLAARKIPVVSVDTAPDKGKIYMIVRADNRAYGTKSCHFLGQQLRGKGKVAMLEGDLTSINGRDRSDAFSLCMRQKHPGITVYPLTTNNWDGAVGASKLQTLLAQHPDINGIYLESSIFLQPTLSLLQSKGLLRPAGTPGHIAIISNDGVPQEYDDIRKGVIDASISQPADLYAKYALYYAEAAVEGKIFKPGPTDHGSTIVQLSNGLEDELPAPVVTKVNVNDKALWGNSTS